MNKTLIIATIILSLVNAGLCIMSDNWSGVCGWVVAAISNIELLGK